MRKTNLFIDILLLVFCFVVAASVSYSVYHDIPKNRVNLEECNDSIYLYQIDSLRMELKEVEYFIKALHQKEASLQMNPRDGLAGEKGPLQILPIAVREFNNTTGCNFKPCFMYDFNNSTYVCKVLLNKGSKMYYYNYGKAPTPFQLARMWNGGIYRGYLYPSTKDYAKDVIINYKTFKQNEEAT
jgi:hypothetical protein